MKPALFLVAGENCMCETCGGIFTKKSNLRKHVQSVHEGAKFECLECGKSYKWYATLHEHRRCCHSTNNEKSSSTICPFCGKVFPNVFMLKRHEHDLHRQGVTNCRKCSLSFESPKEYRKHCNKVHRVWKKSVARKKSKLLQKEDDKPVEQVEQHSKKLCKFV